MLQRHNYRHLSVFGKHYGNRADSSMMSDPPGQRANTRSVPECYINIGFYDILDYDILLSAKCSALYHSVSNQHLASYWPQHKMTSRATRCWMLNAGQDNCASSTCMATNDKKHSFFCCCFGDMCNSKFYINNSTLETANTTGAAYPTTLSAASSSVPADLSYKMKTIVVALVSVAAVSLVIACTYLVYRVYLTPKSTSPPSSSVTRVESEHEAALTQFDLEDLKIEDVLIQGRYSEVRRGWLGDKEVAIKIYQPHHRQYYYNERTAYYQPFMDHDNVVKFYGAKEQEEATLHVMQYLIVTEYISLGTLTSYLKHNTVDWYTLCHMCQGVARGLAHIHTDIQKGDLFKPAMAHRDVNTRNILVKPDLSCVLADFGFAVGMMGSKIIKNGVAENAEQASLADVGTLRYMAPEVFDGAVNLRDCEASLKQIDVYALGLVLWEIASRCVDLYQGAPVPEYHLPFQQEAGIHPTFEEMQVLVVKYKTRPKLPEVWKHSNPAVHSLKETIEDCWDTDAEARLTALCVQERLSDMAALWVQGNKQRGVTPTLNATMNLPEVYSGNNPNLVPPYVNVNNETNAYRGSDSQAPVTSSGIALQVGEQEETYTDGITAPLITNVGHLSASGSSEMVDGRVRSWLQDQSVSESTVDTILPATPSHDETAPVAASVPLKANNVMLAMNKAVISHPNQGRNPTAERNTHKRSDEELTVSGNRLLAPGDQDTGTTSSSRERRGSLDTQSALLNHNAGGHSFDGVDTVESSSLVQNDVLSQHRNNPIPYLQNQVHNDGAALVSAAPSLTRPKLSNISSNRSFYLRLHGEDPSINQRNTEEGLHSKSLKQKLSKLIQPMGLGHKFSKLMFGGKNKKKYNLGSGEVETPCSLKSSGNYVPNGCLGGTNSSVAPGSLNIQVEMVNGIAVTRTCNDTLTYPLHSNITSEAQARLFATNAMRLGVLANDDLPSPSLFPKGNTSSVSNDSRDQETVLSLQNLSSNRDYGSMLSVALPSTCAPDGQSDTSAKRSSTSSLTSSDHRSSSHPHYSDLAYPPASQHDAANLSKIFLDSLNSVETGLAVHSPQNRTISPININVSQVSAAKMPRKKNIFSNLPGTASSQIPQGKFSQDNNLPDTKGGNAIMSVVPICDKSLSRSPHSALPDQVACKKTLSTVSQPQEKTGRDIERNELRKHSPLAKLSQSQSVTDLDRHQHSSLNDFQDIGKICDETNGNHRPRPKSLSLKGHNYNHIKKDTAVPIPAGCSVIMAPVATKPSSSGPSKLGENGTLPVVVPNITLNKSCLPFLSADVDKQRLINSSQNVAVGSLRSTLPTAGSNGFKEGTAWDTCNGHVNAVVSDDKKNLIVYSHSDSSEKIRRRIKTPVSFKKGRLSLYDDRLMSQSLGAESLIGVLTDQTPETCEQRNITALGSDSFQVGSGFKDYNKMIQSDSNLVL
nr:bone morphogenetic protein receptor type-2-like [Biomphalaria glabrata]